MVKIDTPFTDKDIKTLKAVFIDCDGVLYSSQELTNEDIAITGINSALTKYHLSRTELDQIRADLKKRGIRGMFNAIRAMCNNHDISFDEFTKTMVSKIDFSRISPDQELLTLLKQTGDQIPVYIVTNNTRPHLDRIFDCLRGGSTCPNTEKELNIKFIPIEDTTIDGVFQSKKMHGQLTRLCQQFGFDPQNVLLLDDSESVREQAKKEGVLTTPIQHPNDTKKILRRILDEFKNKRCFSIRQTRGGIGD